jgi:hypothetical protein
MSTIVTMSPSQQQTRSYVIDRLARRNASFSIAHYHALMASRGKGTTRSSSRVKTAHTQDNAATRSVPTKQAVHKPLASKDNDIDVVPQPKHQRVKALGSQTPVHSDQECEPIMVRITQLRWSRRAQLMEAGLPSYTTTSRR